MTRPEFTLVNAVSEPLWSTIGNLASEVVRGSHHGSNSKRFPGSESRVETSDDSMQDTFVYGNR